MADAGISNESLLPRNQESRPLLEDVPRRFANTVRKVKDQARRVRESFFKTEKLSPEVNTDPEAEQLNVCQKRLDDLTAQTSNALGVIESTETRTPLTTIQELMAQPAPNRLSKIEGATKTTRFLQREGHKWQDGIQVLLYNKQADNDKAASIENFALETNEQGRIIGRKSLVWEKDGSAKLITMTKAGGKWVSETHPASSETIIAAVDAMTDLYQSEAKQPAEVLPPDTYDKAESDIPTKAITAEAVTSGDGKKETEIPGRREEIVEFARSFLATLNPISRPVSAEVLAKIGPDTSTEDLALEIRGLRGERDMLQLIKYYQGNLDPIPRETIVLGSEQEMGPFDEKALVYVDEYYLDASRAMWATLPRPQQDVLTFQGGEDKVKPDVYLKSITDSTGRKGRLSREKLKESFTLNGCDAVIVAGQMQPTIPKIEISCLGDVTLLSDAYLVPARGTEVSDISIITPKNIILSPDSMLGASSINVDSLRLEGGRLVNPHPNEKTVKVSCNSPLPEGALNPQLFKVTDASHIERQTDLAGVMLRAQLGLDSDRPQYLETMDRSEAVSEFALALLNKLNGKQTPEERERVALEIFGRGATGTTDKSIFAGTLEENIKRWEEDQSQKKLAEQAVTRGVRETLQLVDYYNNHPDVTLPSQIVVVDNETDIQSQVDPNSKALIFFESEWEEVASNRRTIHTLSRLDERAIFTGKNKPDMFMKNVKRGMVQFEGLENLIIDGDNTGVILNIACSGELSMLPRSSLRARVDSLIQAGEIVQRGNITAAEIRCGTFRRESGTIFNPDTRINMPGEQPKLVCEEYIGNPPDNVDLITSVH